MSIYVSAYMSTDTETGTMSTHTTTTTYTTTTVYVATTTLVTGTMTAQWKMGHQST